MGIPISNGRQHLNKSRESATRMQVASICGTLQRDGPMASGNPGVKWNETKMRQCTKMCSTELRRGEGEC